MKYRLLIISFLCLIVSVRSSQYVDLLDFRRLGNFVDFGKLKSNLNELNESISVNDVKFLDRIESRLADEQRLLEDDGQSSTKELQQKFNETCLIDLLFFIQELRLQSRWTLQVLDSFAKPPSSLLLGNIVWPGNFAECRNVSESGNVTVRPFPFIHATFPAKFVGEYCQVVLTNKTAVIAPAVGAFLKSGIVFGICLPSSCNEHGSLEKVSSIVHDVLNNAMDKIGLAYSGLHCPKRPTSLDAPAIVAIIILLSVVTLAVAGTICDSVKRKNATVHSTTLDDASDVHEVNCSATEASSGRTLLLPSLKKLNCLDFISKLIVCFSLRRNMDRLLSTSSADCSSSRNAPLEFLHGLRFLSMAWIILGHTHYFSFAVIENPLDLINPYGHNFMFMSVTQAVYAVDTFFVISGVLVAYTFFGYADRQPDRIESCKFWAVFYFRRFWRLSPTYFLLLGVYVGLLVFIGNGPFWPDGGFEVDQCRATWWSNLLYINNLIYVPVNGSAFGRQMCMGWSWFVSTDVQVFILSPLVLYPIFRRRRRPVWKHVGFVIASLIAIIGMIMTGVLVSVNDLPPNLFPPGFKNVPKIIQTAFDVYFKPYPHMCCYAVGMMVGYLLHQWSKNVEEQRRVPKWIVFLLWTLSTVLCLLIIFGLWPEYRGYIYSRHLSALYQATSRLGWAVSIGWIIVSCHIGYAGIVYRFLSWKVFVPLSRMTYCTYLIHPMLMYLFYFSRRTTVFYTDFTMMWLFGSFLFFSYLASFFVTLLFESPFLALDKHFFG